VVRLERLVVVISYRIVGYMIGGFIIDDLVVATVGLHPLLQVL
jgi:hypothetical protein